MWDMFPEGRESLIASIRRGTLLKVDDGGSQQMLKQMRGLKSEEFEDVYRPQPHGLSSHPPKDSEGFYLALGGRSDRIVALGFEHKDKRPKGLPEGGTALYDADGKVLKFIKDKTEWNAGDKPFELIEATTIKINGKQDVAIGVNGRWIRIRPHRVDIGIESASGQTENAVVTTAGPSTKVFAEV